MDPTQYSEEASRTVHAIGREQTLSNLLRAPGKPGCSPLEASSVQIPLRLVTLLRKQQSSPKSRAFPASYPLRVRQRLRVRHFTQRAKVFSGKVGQLRSGAISWTKRYLRIAWKTIRLGQLSLTQSNASPDTTPWLPAGTASMPIGPLAQCSWIPRTRRSSRLRITPVTPPLMRASPGPTRVHSLIYFRRMRRSSKPRQPKLRNRVSGLGFISAAISTQVSRSLRPSLRR